jgi:hypothetical protein
MEVQISKKNKIENKKSIVVQEIYNTETEYDHFKKLYKNLEFIPSTFDIINTILKHHFPTSEIIHKFSENYNHLLIKITIKDLLNASLYNWKYNRPPDMSRCPDIARYIYYQKKPIDTIIYLSYNNMLDQFDILDGIHRLTALRIIKEENSKPLDFISFSEFGSNNDATWLYNQYIILNMYFNASEENLMEIFRILNKSQSVPQLYIKDNIQEKIKLIEKLANEWQIKYKKHFSSSANPNLGNTNRNKFIDLLDRLYDKYKINSTNIDILKNKLEYANTQLSFDIPSKASIDVRLKCKETGCYLFLLKNDKLEEYI